MRRYQPTTLPALSAGLAPDDGSVAANRHQEEDEYAALMSAAVAAGELLGGQGRRVVVVAEVDHPDQPIPMSQVVAVHCDVADRPADADPDEDLAWFATQEIPDLL